MSPVIYFELSSPQGYLPPPIDTHIKEELEYPQSTTVRHPPSHQYSSGYEPPQYDYLPPKPPVKDEKHPYASYIVPGHEVSTPKGKISENIGILLRYVETC